VGRFGHLRTPVPYLRFYIFVAAYCDLLRLVEIRKKSLTSHAFLRVTVSGGGVIFIYLLTDPEPFFGRLPNCAATQELSDILWNLKVYYRVRNSPPLVPVLSQIDPVHTTLSCLSKIYFNVVHPPTSWSS
jgi:hypothetical protein